MVEWLTESVHHGRFVTRIAKPPWDPPVSPAAPEDSLRPTRQLRAGLAPPRTSEGPAEPFQRAASRSAAPSLLIRRAPSTYQHRSALRRGQALAAARRI